MSTEEIIDVIVIGGGLAGLAAAVSLPRNLHSVLVFDSQEYRNARAGHMHMMPTWDGKHPKDFRAAARQDILNHYDTVSFVNGTIKSVNKRDDGIFTVIDTEEQNWNSRGVILASGIIDTMLDVPGFAECWGYTIYHCLFCFGYEMRGAVSSGVIAAGPQNITPFVLHIARNAAQLSKQVTIYTHGDSKTADAYRAAIGMSAPISIDTRIIQSFDSESDNTAVKITFEDRSTKNETFLAYYPRNDLRSRQIFKDLDLDMKPQGSIKVDLFGETSLPGCFAAGDNCSLVKTMANAVTTGATAASGAAGWVQSLRYKQPSLGEYLREMESKQ